jgi:acyl-CoA synthetase (AMP-forming)/AMP-acid ligase II
MMRILTLTSEVERELLRARQQRDLAAGKIAARIVQDVRKRGDGALFAWAKKFDACDLRRDGVWISPKEMRAACTQVAPEFLRAVEHAARNVARVAQQQLPRPWQLQVDRGVRIAQLVRPLDSIGCYIPGGRFALVSTLIMTVVPARVAGVKRVTVVCPKPNAELLAAAIENRKLAADYEIPDAQRHNLPEFLEARLQPWRDEGLLPYPNHAFLGYRLLTEFFTFPNKFLFFDLGPSPQSKPALLTWGQTDCLGRIASFKIPRHVFLVESLPTTSSGKIRKVDLREQARRLLGA